MKAPKEIIEGYQEIKSWGVLARMMKAAKIKSHTHMSNIVHGKTDTTAQRISAIKKFIAAERIELAQLTDDQN